MATRVFELLEAIYARPEMYVGGDSNDRIGQLERMELLMAGYSTAIRMHGIAECVENFPRELAAFASKRRGWGTGISVIHHIVGATENKESAWALYWELVQEFRDSVLSNEPTSSASSE